jgi:hypothetical protein
MITVADVTRRVVMGLPAKRACVSVVKILHVTLPLDWLAVVVAV